jgi:hypothetical protein
MTSEMTHGPPDDGATDWKGLSVIALAMSAVAIPIIAGKTLVYRLSDQGASTMFWFWIGVSAVLAATASVRSIKLIRSRQTRRGMAWVGLSLSLPLLLLHALSAAGTLVLWMLFRNWEF